MTAAEIKREELARRIATRTNEALRLFDTGYSKDAVAHKLLKGNYGFRSKAEALDHVATSLYHRFMSEMANCAQKVG